MPKKVPRLPPRGDMHPRQLQPATGVPGHLGGSRRLFVCLALAWFGLFATAPFGVALDSADQDKEFRVKSAAVYHFIRYTTWPKSSFDSDGAPVLVLIVGQTPMRKHLEAALVGKQVGERKIAVAQIDAPPEHLTAHFVFEGHLPPQQQQRLLELARGKPHFLFGDRPGYARSGAGGNFLLEAGKVVFELNPKVLKAAGLSVSSQLLKLARIVQTDEGGSQ